ESIKNISRNASASLQYVAENGIKNFLEFDIKCGELDDFNYLDIRGSEKYKGLFNDLKRIEGPVVYYFEIMSDNISTDIVTQIRQYAASENSKAIPAIKSTIPESKILYAGKVKKGFGGRLVQHLGFYKVNGTQGLQLYYWAKELDLDIKLRIFEFEPQMADLMTVIENGLARELNPILGKHKQ